MVFHPLCQILLVRNKSQVGASLKGVNARRRDCRGRFTPLPTPVWACGLLYLCILGG